jgi:DNA helicase HerA-like ATPase
MSKIPSPNTIIALSWRLNSLENSNIFNGTTHALIRAMQDRQVCVLRGSMEQIHVVSSHVIEKLYYMRRSFIDAREVGHLGDIEPFPPFFIGMDEAHLFCPHNDSFSLTKRIMKTIAQEGRKYGVFELLATQRPSLLDPTIVAQIANKFIFRLSIKEDIESIKKETDLNEGEIKKLPYMSSGESYISSSIIGRTLFVKIRYGITTAKTTTNPFDEFGVVSSLTPAEEILLQSLPFTTDTAINVLARIKTETGGSLKLAELIKMADGLASKGLMKVEEKLEVY